jgi:hypothetical protein
MREVLQRAVSCVTADVLTGRSDAVASNLTLISRLARRSGDGPLTLTLQHYFALVADTTPNQRNRWQAKVVTYYYTLDDTDGREILAYHWHPSGRSQATTPHLHLGAGAGTLRPELTKAYLQTGLVTPVALLSLVVEQYGVQPRRADWPGVLERTLRALEMP